MMKHTGGHVSDSRKCVITKLVNQNCCTHSDEILPSQMKQIKFVWFRFSALGRVEC
jgi:hypothetical protein